jgi:hypothetical protein
MTVLSYIDDNTDKHDGKGGDTVSDDWLTKTEAAALLGISTRTLERYERDGRVTSRLRGGARWYSRSALQSLGDVGGDDDSVKQTRSGATPETEHTAAG